MIPASELRKGMVLKIGGVLHRVIESNYHVGGGKAGAMVHAKLKPLGSSHFLEKRFSPDEKVEDADVEKKSVEFSYESGGEYFFMDPVSYEQVSFTKETIGHAAAYIREGMKVTADFWEGNPIDVTLPELIEVQVSRTSEPTKSETDGTYKDAGLDNGKTILVPQFIKSGDYIMVKVETGEYVERVREKEKKKPEPPKKV